MIQIDSDPFLINPMPLHWPEATVRHHELTVYMFPAASRSTVWINVLGHLLKEFNAVTKKHKLPMRMKASTQPPKDGSGADVGINIATDKITLTLPRADPIAETFDGKRLHGRTILAHEERSTELTKAYVYLPATPQTLPPSGGWRLVGPKVRTLIALHELLHACGLENEDHGDFGLFQGNPTVNPDTTGTDDTLTMRQNHGSMPPYVIDDETVKTLLD